MNKAIVIKQVEYGTHVGQGMTASGEGGYDIWIRHEDNYMDFLGFIKDGDLVDTIMYYEGLGDKVEVRYLPHE